MGKFDPEQHFRFMKEQAKIIREQSFDINQIRYILERLKDSIELWRISGNAPVKETNKMAEAMFEIFLALEISHSNYRKENKNMWTRIFSFGTSKIPNIDIKKLIK